MAIDVARSSRRGGRKTAALHQLTLLRVEGTTYTLAELAHVLDLTLAQVRSRARELIHRRKPYTLDDFRS